MHRSGCEMCWAACMAVCPLSFAGSQMVYRSRLGSFFIANRGPYIKMFNKCVNMQLQFLKFGISCLMYYPIMYLAGQLVPSKKLWTECLFSNFGLISNCRGWDLTNWHNENRVGVMLGLFPQVVLEPQGQTNLQMYFTICIYQLIMYIKIGIPFPHIIQTKNE